VDRAGGHFFADPTLDVSFDFRHRRAFASKRAFLRHAFRSSKVEATCGAPDFIQRIDAQTDPPRSLQLQNITLARELIRRASP
jgi:hypothetical protein